MDNWVLDYQDRLVLTIPQGANDSFAYSGFYKIRLKRYVTLLSENIVVFKSTLNYLDFKKIIQLLMVEVEKSNSYLVITPALRDYIENCDVYVEKRSRLGMEIKNRDEKFKEQFTIYKDTVNALMSRPLREQQMWDSFFMCAMQKSANFSVPGSGKTASVLGMYAYLKSKQLVNRIVVICPKNAFGSWMDEFDVCFRGIEAPRVFNVHNTIYKNATARRKGLLYESGGCNLFLINYEAVGSVKEALSEVMGNNSLLVYDEVHKIKRIGGEYAEHALEIAEKAHYVVAMTGTPIPNSYLDIYNFLHILFPAEYDDFFDFSIPVLRHPTGRDEEEINNKMQPFFCRTTKENLGVPAANPDSIYSLHASENENRIFDILRKKYKKKPLALFIRTIQLENNPKLLLQNLNLNDYKYLLNEEGDIEEIDFADYSDEIKNLIETCGKPTKQEVILQIIEEKVKNNKPVVVWCVLVDSIHCLARELRKKDILVKTVFGEVPLEERLRVLDDFKQNHVQVLITNPHTLAESVSLHSVCHDAIYYEYSYNLVHLLQSKDRIHRLGLPEGQYTQYDYLQLFYELQDGTQWSMDKAVYDRLMLKERIMLEAIDHQVLETMPTSDEDLAIIFEKLF